MESFRLMMEAGDYIPDHVQPWLLWLQVVLIGGPVLFVKHRSARYLLLAQLLNAVAAYFVFVAEGNNVTKLFGVGHFFWLFPLWFLAHDFRSEKRVAYRWFAGIAAATIAISLVLDTRDTVLWIAGQRESVLVNVPADHPLAD